MVGDDYRPLLIDYAEVDIAAAAHDPVSLELSVLFHPRGREIVGTWPSPEQARGWAKLAEYLEGCPVAEFVRACRGWAHEVSAGPREVYAHAYSFALRQLQYPDTNHSTALAIAAANIQSFD